MVGEIRPQAIEVTPGLTLTRACARGYLRGPTRECAREHDHRRRGHVRGRRGRDRGWHGGAHERTQNACARDHAGRRGRVLDSYSDFLLCWLCQSGDASKWTRTFGRDVIDVAQCLIDECRDVGVKKPIDDMATASNAGDET
jgi:hypothetical protein